MPDALLAPPQQKTQKNVPVQILERSPTGGKIRISTAAYDRDSDRVLPGGGQIANYLNNPVVQYGHRYDEPWTTIGKTTILDVGPDYIDVEFELRAPAYDNDQQYTVIQLWQLGFLNAASIGFLPLTWKANERGGWDFLTWELLEWSLVPIPANAEALARMVKALAADTPKELPAPAATNGQLVVKSISLNDQLNAVSTALYYALRTDRYAAYERDEWEFCCWCEAVYDTFAIARIGLEFYRVDYTIEGGRVLLAERTDWMLVEQAWVAPLASETFAKDCAAAWAQLDAAEGKGATRRKAGARHSKQDTEVIQRLHDDAVTLGALCTAGADDDETKAGSPEEVIPEIETKQSITAPDDLSEADLVALAQALDALSL